MVRILRVNASGFTSSLVKYGDEVFLVDDLSQEHVARRESLTLLSITKTTTMQRVFLKRSLRTSAWHFRRFLSVIHQNAASIDGLKNVRVFHVNAFGFISNLGRQY